MDFDYWPPNMVCHLIGGLLIEVGLHNTLSLTTTYFKILPLHFSLEKASVLVTNKNYQHI